MNSSYGLWKPQKSKLLLAVPACILLMCMYYLYAVAGTEANDRPLVSTWKYLSPREQASNSTLGVRSQPRKFEFRVVLVLTLLDTIVPENTGLVGRYELAY